MPTRLPGAPRPTLPALTPSARCQNHTRLDTSDVLTARTDPSGCQNHARLDACEVLTADAVLGPSTAPWLRVPSTGRVRAGAAVGRRRHPPSVTGRPSALDDARVRRLLRTQRRIASRGQLLAAGIGWEEVGYHVAAARWIPLGPSVLALDNGILDVEQLRWAAVLAAGPRAALCAWTALQQHGLRGYERDEVHLVVPRGERPVGLGRESGVRVVVHESRRHLPDDVVRRTGHPPVHRPARAVVDAAAWGPSDRAAAGILTAAVQQRLVTPAGVGAELDRAGRVRRAALVRQLLHDVAGGVEALSELDFALLCRRAGLPEPQRQRFRRDAEGRRRYLDVEWVRARDGRRVVVEVDGRGHMREDVWEDDLLKANDVTIDEAAIVLRVAGITVRTRPQRVVAQLRRVLV